VNGTDSRAAASPNNSMQRTALGAAADAERWIDSGTMHVISMSRDSRLLWAASLYSLALAGCAVLLGFLGLLAIGIVSGGGEDWIGTSLYWWYSLPALVALAILSAFLYPIYRRQRSWARVTAFFLMNVVAIILASFAVTRILLHG
jgi:hypothetical protein